MKTATRLKDVTDGYTGTAFWFQLDPPLEHEDWLEEKTLSYEHVIVSATIVQGAPETYVFGATPEGTIANWTELSPSRKGFQDCDKVLKDAGYTIVEP